MFLLTFCLRICYRISITCWIIGFMVCFILLPGINNLKNPYASTSSLPQSRNHLAFPSLLLVTSHYYVPMLNIRQNLGFAKPNQ
ncbi:hypothetical protein VNO77_32544 [Canavalia gladiata]|uniref:Uncharacterized protein n=1 Tax=Canavalia gladiata TaxID=3824 RepID=A0AAN9Q295_CANGL